MIFAMFMVWVNPPLAQGLIPQSVFIEQFTTQQACKDALPKFNALAQKGWEYQCFERQTPQWRLAN